MQLNISTVRFKMLSILIVVFFGITILAANAYMSNHKLTQINDQLSHLQESQAHLERLKGLIEENERLSIQIVFQKKTELSAQLLAKNEDILNEFEVFRNDAYSKQLDDDYYYAVENETLLLSLRKGFYSIVANVKKGKQHESEQQVFKLLNNKVRPILSFMRNAEIIRNLRIRDTRKKLILLKHETTQRTVFIYAAIFLTTLIIIYLVTRSIVRPLESLLNTMLDILNYKDLSKRASVKSSDEIGQLTHSFNNLIDQLEKSTRQTEEVNLSLEQSKNKLVQEANKRELLIDQLEGKNVELERFTYTVSHDLKSPLVTVKGFIGLLKKDMENGNTERVNQDITHISMAADKMTILLEDLLELSRIGRVINKPQILCLSELFEEALSLLQVQIEESGAIINIQNDMPSIFADKIRMMEVAQNLMDNAIKFRRKECTPKITVSASLSNGHVVCRVTDNGVGINPKYFDKIFGLFNRLDVSFEGTGVGLALVKRIIEVHNGDVTVESNGDGQGTTFCFSLPR